MDDFTLFLIAFVSGQWFSILLSIWFRYQATKKYGDK